MIPERRLVVVKVMVILGFVFTTFGLTLGLATYVVPGWYTYNPNSPPATPSSWDQIQRTRGIFQECSTAKGLSVSVASPYIIKNDCFDNDIGQYPSTYSTSDANFMAIIRLRQSQLVLHGISLVFALVILLVGLGIVLKWCGARKDSNFYIKWRLALGLVTLLIFFIMASSPSIGHAIDYVESNGYTTALLPYEQSNIKVTRTWGYMYMLAWVSAGLYLIAAMFFLISVCLGSRLEEEKYKPRIISADNPTFTGADEKINKPVFLTPVTNQNVYDFTYGNISPNDSISPGLLPRYTISP